MFFMNFRLSHSFWPCFTQTKMWRPKVNVRLVGFSEIMNFCWNMGVESSNLGKICRKLTFRPPYFSKKSKFQKFLHVIIRLPPEDAVMLCFRVNDSRLLLLSTFAVCIIKNSVIVTDCLLMWGAWIIWINIGLYAGKETTLESSS